MDKNGSVMSCLLAASVINKLLLLIDPQKRMHILPTQLNFVQERQRRHSYTVTSEHVINTPKIVRFMYSQTVQPKVTSVYLPQENNIYPPLADIDDHVWCYRQQKMSSKPSSISNGQSERAVSQTSSNKFSLLTRKINATVSRRHTHVANREEMGNEGNTCLEHKAIIDQKRYTTNEPNQRYYRDHISFEAPTCNLFCDPQEIKTDSLQPRFTHRRQKIFSHATPILSLTPSKQFTNQTRTNQRHQQQRLDYFQYQKQCGKISTKEESVAEQDVPSCILQSWNAIQTQQKDDLLLSSAMHLGLMQ